MTTRSNQRAAALLERVPIAGGGSPLALVTAVALVALATVIRFAIDPALPPGFPYISYFPAVALSAFLFGFRAGALTAALSALAAWYWFIPPVGFGIGPGTRGALLFYAVVVAVELAILHMMQVANAHLRIERERSARLAETRSLLFKELQHRVSNNIQVTAALLSLQRQKLTDEGAREALDEAARRLALIGRISRQLYDPEGSAVGLGAFLKTLGADLIESHGRNEVTLTVAAEDEVQMSPDAAIPLALIVAEAVANALEHGFKDGRPGKIDVRLGRVDAEELCLEVKDNGAGLPPEFEIEKASSLGLRIATTLARQLGGRFVMLRGEGATAQLTIPG